MEQVAGKQINEDGFIHFGYRTGCGVTRHFYIDQKGNIASRVDNEGLGPYLHEGTAAEFIKKMYDGQKVTIIEQSWLAISLAMKWTLGVTHHEPHRKIILR